MGGNILTLPSDLIREGRAAGREEGRNDAIFSYVEKGLISMEQGAKDTSLSIEDFKKAMIDAGYQPPENI